MSDTEATFGEWLAVHKRGSVDDELTALLRELVQAAQMHGKAGSVTLTINVQPHRDLDLDAPAFKVWESIKAKIPEADRLKSTYFTNPAGELLRNPPGQDRLPFQPVNEQENSND